MSMVLAEIGGSPYHEQNMQRASSEETKRMGVWVLVGRQRAVSAGDCKELPELWGLSAVALRPTIPQVLICLTAIVLCFNPVP
jgi:hypothetical protein